MTDAKIAPLRGVGSTTPTRRDERPRQPSRTQIMDDAKVAMEARANAAPGGRAGGSFGMMHYTVAGGLLRLDVAVGLVGHPEQLAAALREMAAIVEAGRHSIEGDL